MGMRNRRIHHHGRPTILSRTIQFQIGMIAFQPASPAFVKTHQNPAMIRTTTAR